MNRLSIYVHIPFCDHKCIYCDFYSILSAENEEKFIDSLKKEIEHYAGRYSNQYKVNTIYFGGGTPSLIDAKHIEAILNSIAQCFAVDGEAEITLEANPGTLSESKLKEYLRIGVTRISIGVQSFDEAELKFLTRIHDKQTAINTVEKAAKAGFQNINIDLIFNIPGQTKKKWKSNLKHAVSLPVNHISAYSLILERGTILNKMVLDGRVKISGADYDADLYNMTIDFLAANSFEQYEVSNFAKAGAYSIHNLAYWQHKEYLGFGTAAHSFIGDRRWWNFSSLKMYISAVNTSANAAAGSESLSEAELLDEYVMLNLRSRGLNLAELELKYGGRWISNNSKYINSLIEKGFLAKSNNFIKFTKQGYSICDEILSKFT